ncbi:hypothetical protein GCK72_007031 [Caenorhabditis remanei]|uniref:Uncharacterized protein n=1 Tax=Caenorhabditis remanei TaxID=31234 RepID=A0A6A5HL09_CAERE|nr:hypothetical protein GCK72_007031 [Caenorhabditis remanei]KAF1767073.1 hypothetical protein GCK72_007031 [Caenorhabditis remanei]
MVAVESNQHARRTTNVTIAFFRFFNFIIAFRHDLRIDQKLLSVPTLVHFVQKRLFVPFEFVDFFYFFSNVTVVQLQLVGTHCAI